MFLGFLPYSHRISYCSLPTYIVACIFEGVDFQHHILHLPAHRFLHRGWGAVLSLAEVLQVKCNHLIGIRLWNRQQLGIGQRLVTGGSISPNKWAFGNGVFWWYISYRIHDLWKLHFFWWGIFWGVTTHESDKSEYFSLLCGLWLGIVNSGAPCNTLANTCMKHYLSWQGMFHT